MCVRDMYTVQCHDTILSQLNSKVFATEKFGQDLEAEDWPGSTSWTLTVTLS